MEGQAPQRMGFGFQDDTADELKGKSMDGVFGLNQNARLVHFAYNPNAGKDETLADAIDITVQIGESEQKRRIYDITKVFDKDNNEIADTTSQAWINGYNETWTQNSAMITHVLKAFVTEEVIKQALQQPLNGFADWARVVTALLPQGFENTPIDVFLEYQWNIPEGRDQTYLQLPKNMKGGYWLCAAQPGQYKPNISDKGAMVYTNEQNQAHPFTRNKNFMEGNKANKQTVNDALNAASGGGNPQSGSW